MEKKNVDGFRIDAFKHIYENETFENEPFSSKYKGSSNATQINYDHLQHIHTTGQRETFELLNEWRNLFDQISKRTKRTK